MRLKALPALALLLLAGAGAAQAQVTQLTFEGLANGQVIGNYYNGGAGGPLGITFGNTAQGLISSAAGGSGNFQGQPSGVTIMFFPSATNAFMDVAAGFETGISLFYTAIGIGGSLSVYDGFGGTGSLLGTVMLPITPSLPGTPPCPGPQGFCPFEAASLAFAGTARSAVFGGGANQIGYDNVTFGSTSPVTATPEPASLALLATGLVGVFGATRRKHLASSTT
jgi:hypothetical protein